MTIFGTTQSDGGFGGIAIQGESNSDQQAKIRRATFGDGSQSGGLIDANNLHIGGLGRAVGDAMSAEAMKESLDPRQSLVLYQNWLDPIRSALTHYGINTPAQISAFFSQVLHESDGLASPVENPLRFTEANLRNPALFGTKFTGYSGHNSATGAPLDWAATAFSQSMVDWPTTSIFKRGSAA